MRLEELKSSDDFENDDDYYEYIHEWETADWKDIEGLMNAIDHALGAHGLELIQGKGEDDNYYVKVEQLGEGKDKGKRSEIEASLMTKMKIFQREAVRLNRNPKSVKEFKLWLEAQEQRQAIGKQKGPDVGETIEVYDFRTDEMLPAEVTSKPSLNQDTGLEEVDVVFEDGMEHYAVWNDDEMMWESGEL
jgi:hypothetical protein